MNQPCVIILTTTNVEEIADRITQALLEADMAACVQVDKVKSCFKWEGKIEQETEYRLMIKAKSSNYVEIEKIIVSNHNYTLPQIVRLDIAGGLPAYLNWISESHSDIA